MVLRRVLIASSQSWLDKRWVGRHQSQDALKHVLLYLMLNSDYSHTAQINAQFWFWVFFFLFFLLRFDNFLHGFSHYNVNATPSDPEWIVCGPEVTLRHIKKMTHRVYLRKCGGRAHQRGCISVRAEWWRDEGKTMIKKAESTVAFCGCLCTKVRATM